MTLTVRQFLRQYFVYLLPSVVIAYLVLESYQMDFRPYYVAGKLLLLGRDPYLNAVTDFPALYVPVNAEAQAYSGFIYPPFATFLFAPLALLPYGTAKLVYSGLSLACLWSLLFWVARLVQFELTGGAIALVMCSFPVLAHFERGQFDLFVCGLTVVSFGLYRRGQSNFQSNFQSNLPALCLALAIGTKIFPFVALIYWIVNKQFRLVLKTLGILVFLVIAPWFYFGTAVYQNYGKTLLPKIFGPLIATGPIDTYGQRVVYRVVQAIDGNNLRITHDFVNGYMNPFLRNPAYSFTVGLVGLAVLIFYTRHQVSIESQFFACLNAIHLINPNTWIMGLVWYVPFFLDRFDRASNRNKIILALPLFLPPSTNANGMLAYVIALVWAIRSSLYKSPLLMVRPDSSSGKSSI
jgi:Glycosyltransferase family 87